MHPRISGRLVGSVFRCGVIAWLAWLSTSPARAQEPTGRVPPACSELRSAFEVEVPCLGLTSMLDCPGHETFRVVGTCPDVLDLRRRRIQRTLVFQAPEMTRMDLSGIRLEGALRVIAPHIDQLVLRDGHVEGPIFIADRDQVYGYIDDDADCECDNSYQPNSEIRVIDAEMLHADRLEVHGLTLSVLSIIRGRVPRGVSISRSEFEVREADQAQGLLGSFLVSDGVEVNAARFGPGTHLDVPLARLSGSASFECSILEGGDGSRQTQVNLWGSDLGSGLNLQGVQFQGDHQSGGEGGLVFYAFLFRTSKLQVDGAQGRIPHLDMRDARVGVLALDRDQPCKGRQLGFGAVETRGMTFDRITSSLIGQDANAVAFFSAAAKEDPNLYLRLSESFERVGQLDEADEAFRLASPLFGRARSVGGRWVVPSTVLLILIIVLTTGAIQVSGWPKGAGLAQRVVLVADLLLPDLVDLGGKAAFEEDLKGLRGYSLAMLALLRIAGWLVVSLLVYGVIARSSY